MLIGIIGAGLSGLVAGRRLAKAGHEVIVFEKSNGFGGRMATRYDNTDHDIKFDHGCPHLAGNDPRFKEFIQEMTEKGIVKPWCDGFHFWNGEQILRRHPERSAQQFYYAHGGMNEVGKYLSRWVDVRRNSRVIGFTYLGDKKGKKKPWMINLEDFNVVEVDAIIVATPAVQAYGLIENTQDETVFRSIIKDIDSVTYNPKFSLMLTYEGEAIPEWEGMYCNDNTIHWVGNESSKRDNKGKLTLVCHSKGEFARNHIFESTSDEVIRTEMVLALRKIIGDWAGRFDASQIRRWRYSQPRNYFDYDFVKAGYDNAPVAIVGDYMKGGSLEHAFLSGFELAEYWIHEYANHV